ncbi:MAG: hypothetical protein HY870_09270 [Chloroflexi bacterium]|nr:hypothetical protein [Chloroflexota bacterium]
MRLIEFLLYAGVQAVSLFNTVILLWLGLTVILTGDRRKPATIAGSAGLLLGALFFMGHTFIIGHSLNIGGRGVDTVWKVMWVVAITAPYFWGLSIFYYSGNAAAGKWVRRALTAALFFMIVSMAFVLPLPSIMEFMLAPVLAPIIAWAYVPYLFLCFTLPLIALRRRSNEARLDPFRRARPWLIGTAIMLTLAVLTFAYAAYAIVPQAIPIYTMTSAVLLQLYAADGAVAGFIALAIILLGRAVVSNAVLTERPQSNRGFFMRWRNVVGVAILGSGFIALLYTAPIPPIYSLMLTAILAVIAYALFNWRQYVEHAEFMQRLDPFVKSLHLHDHLLSSGTDTWTESRDLFTALCREALGAERACLAFEGAMPATGSQRLDYQWSPAHEAVVQQPIERPGEWARLAGEQLARVAVNLLQQRIAQVQVLSAQHKRIIHDEVLPQIHLALLKVEGLRAAGQEAARSVTDNTRIDEATNALTQAHRRLSGLVREMSNAVPTRLESEGLIAALHSAVDHDFRDSFDALDWQVDPGAQARAQRLPLFVSEVIFFAAQEAIRNAARHGRGAEANRKLKLDVAIQNGSGLTIVIGDDGVGRAATRAKGETGNGLAFHSTMLAVVGGTLSVEDRSGGGTQVVISVPES